MALKVVNMGTGEVEDIDENDIATTKFIAERQRRLTEARNKFYNGDSFVDALSAALYALRDAHTALARVDGFFDTGKALETIGDQQRTYDTRVDILDIRLRVMWAKTTYESLIFGHVSDLPLRAEPLIGPPPGSEI